MFYRVDCLNGSNVFIYSCLGTIITDSLASTFPTVIAYVVDSSRSTNPTTFMSNMLYACSILYRTKLPFFLVLNVSETATLTLKSVLIYANSCRNVMLFDRTISSIGWKILRHFNRFIAIIYFYARNFVYLWASRHQSQLIWSDNTIAENFNQKTLL